MQHRHRDEKGFYGILWNDVYETYENCKVLQNLKKLLKAPILRYNCIHSFTASLNAYCFLFVLKKHFKLHIFKLFPFTHLFEMSHLVNTCLLYILL